MGFQKKSMKILVASSQVLYLIETVRTIDTEMLFSICLTSS